MASTFDFEVGLTGMTREHRPHPFLCYRGQRHAKFTKSPVDYHDASLAFPMNFRNALIITATLCLHQLLLPALLTSQLLSPTFHPQELPAAPSSINRVPVIIKSLRQEKSKSLYQLEGAIEIDYESYVLRADKATYNADTGDLAAAGHVMLDGGPNDEHIEAESASYNLRLETGTFYDVKGAIGVKVKPGRVLLTSSNPFSFTGRRLEKLSPDHYMVYDGSVTTCQLPKPRWQFNAHKVKVDVGGNAKIYDSTFHLYGLPVFYFPFATHPAERIPRQTGFLIPNFGQSSVKGTIFGESIFVAISRSMDATIGAEYFSQRGWAPQGQFRARPSDTSFLDLKFFSVFDRGYGHPPVNQGGEDVRLDAASELPHNFRGVADIDYLSSYLFRLAFNDVYTQAVNSEVKSNAFLSNTTNGYFYNLDVQRYQDYESTTGGDVITILHAPSLELDSVDRQIGHLPLYWFYDSVLGGVSRTQPSFRTNTLVGRFDFRPGIALPLRFSGWSLRPEFAVRETYYTQSVLPAFGGIGLGIPQSGGIDRKAVETSVDIRPPTLSRVFDGELFGRKWKHVIEPDVIYRNVSGVDNFLQIIRFDERDILSDTNEFEYRLVNRLYAKKLHPSGSDCATPGMPSLFVGGAPPHSLIPWQKPVQPSDSPCTSEPQVKEVITWELAQKYFFDPTFGGALVIGVPNVLATTEDLTGIAFITEQRRLSPLLSRLRYQASARTDVEWDLDYDFHSSHINASTALLNYRVGPLTLGGGDAFLQAPGETITVNNVVSPALFNQFRVLVGYGYPNKRGFSSAVNVGVDADLYSLQYTSLQATYNWDCCGFNMEYQRFALGTVPNENQFRFTFSLSNIGAFGNLRRDTRLY